MTKIVFFGNERLISGLDHTDTPILRSLIEAGYEVAAVVTNDAGTRSRKRKILEVAELAEANDIPVHTPHRPMDIYDQLAAYQADVAVLVAYGRIVPQKLIDLFPHGIVNVHPSLLPQYRGPSPIESAIANGDDVTGVSIMALSAKMDAGPVYRQIEMKLDGTETAPSLSEHLATLAATELSTALTGIINGSITPVEQDESSATYCQLISKEDAVLKPEEQTAEQAERLVRAYRAFPRARMNVLGHDIIILKAYRVAEPQTELDIAFKDKAYLRIDELISPNGKTMSPDAFLRGYKK